MKKMIIKRITLGITTALLVASIPDAEATRKNGHIAMILQSLLLPCQTTVSVLIRGMSTPTTRMIPLSLLKMIRAIPSKCVTRWMGIR